MLARSGTGTSLSLSLSLCFSLCLRLLLLQLLLHPTACKLTQADTTTETTLTQEELSALSSLSVVWDFGGVGCTGWASEAITYVLALKPILPKLRIIAGDSRRSFCPGLDSKSMDTLMSMRLDNKNNNKNNNNDDDDDENSSASKLSNNKNKNDNNNNNKNDDFDLDNIDIFISHKPPQRYPKWPYRGIVTINKKPKYVIGRSMTEVDVAHSSWMPRLSSVDEVWVPSSHSFSVFLDALRSLQNSSSSSSSSSHSPSSSPSLSPSPSPSPSLPVLTLIHEAFDPVLFPHPHPLEGGSGGGAAGAGAGAGGRGETLDLEGLRNKKKMTKMTKREEDVEGSGSESKNDTSDSNNNDNVSEGVDFVSTFKLEPRKGWHELITAFILEFCAMNDDRNSDSDGDSDFGDDVSLTLHTYLFGEYDPRNPVKVRSKIVDYIKRAVMPLVESEWAAGEREPECKVPTSQINILTDEIPAYLMASFYRSFTAFVLPTHGEGFGLPLLESMGVGVPVIATNWSGVVDFVSDEHGFLISVEGMEQAEGSDFEDGQKWAKPNVQSLRKILRFVSSNPAVSRSVGVVGSSFVHKYFSMSTIRDQIAQRMTAIKHIIQKREDVKKRTARQQRQNR